MIYIIYFLSPKELAAALINIGGGGGGVGGGGWLVSATFPSVGFLLAPIFGASVIKYISVQAQRRFCLDADQRYCFLIGAPRLSEVVTRLAWLSPSTPPSLPFTCEFVCVVVFV